MSRKLFTLTAIAAALALPTTASAYEIIGKQLEIYGQAHLSMDFVDNDTDSELALASNSSRLGFKGVTAINDQLNAIYQIESKIIFDEGGDNFAGRNTFVGLGGDFGKVLFGNQDTPVKNIRGVFDLFGDTVADARNVADQANRRAKNSIQYITPEMGGLIFGAMYSTAFEDTETEEGLENNDYSLMSAAVGYTAGGFEITAGYEKTDADVTEDETDAARLAAGYDFGGFRLGGMYDRVEADDADRDAWGANGMFTFGANALKVQYMMADDWSDVDDSGATQLSVGLDHSLAKNLKLYGIYSQLDNDDNTAAYRIKGGHDTDVYEVVAAGDDISVFSLGMVYKF
ncbi:Outer membrane protein (porin) [Halopseudomonas xinjiangensis]|uniref:Outer membrane protein (Porin) n=1 Tax=Halopseudomonas xinjiangensis TaxID=487184 RepID=A0A1H1QLQ0_9GAMM|nr:porin [Halopseudomonas xinjiangensis]SDS24316.1 Outer membrane protein (porin) [Halopseudomonas xinjiangensis]